VFKTTFDFGAGGSRPVAAALPVTL